MVFEYALGLAEDIATRIHQYGCKTNIFDNITPPFTKALFTYAKEAKIYLLVRRVIWQERRIRKPAAVCFMTFASTLKADVSIGD